jgi:cytochrome c2
VATDAKRVGPSLKGIVERAKTRIEGKDAETYISESILKPNDHIVEGFVEGLMPTGYEAELVEDGNDEQLRDLVAYLMTL